MAEGDDPVSPLYEKEVLSGPKLHSLVMGADSDEDFDKIRRSLDHHGMDSSVLNRKRGGKIKGAKAKTHPGRKARAGGGGVDKVANFPGGLPGPDAASEDFVTQLQDSDRAPRPTDKRMEKKPPEDIDPSMEIGKTMPPRKDTRA